MHAQVRRVNKHICSCLPPITVLAHPPHSSLLPPLPIPHPTTLPIPDLSLSLLTSSSLLHLTSPPPSSHPLSPNPLSPLYFLPSFFPLSISPLSTHPCLLTPFLSLLFPLLSSSHAQILYYMYDLFQNSTMVLLLVHYAQIMLI